MAFFARPNLDDTQFKQLPDSVLSLSGVTHVQNVTGFTLMDDTNTPIPIVVTGATNDYVLTYDSLTTSIRLKCSASAGAFNYSGASPTTCTVGGLTTGSPIFNCPIGEILQSILVPTLNPTLSPNTISMSISPPSPLIYQIGCLLALTSTIIYGQGSVSPVYCGGPSVRTGVATGYSYTNIDGGNYNGVSSSCLLPAASVTYGTNTVYGVAYYAAGFAPLRSDGTPMSGVTCAASNKSTCKTITGLYPYFWGATTVAPNLSGDSKAQCLITGSTCGCCIGYSTDDVLVSNYNVTGKYVWVAIPSLSTTKTKWQGSNSPSNCGSIPGDLFAAACARNITSPSTCWGSTSYKFYVSNYGTSINYGMTFKNS